LIAAIQDPAQKQYESTAELWRLAGELIVKAQSRTDVKFEA
jgi:hypothetical protein